jgi:hypothetical protein
MTLAGRVCLDNRTKWDEALALHREQLRFYLNYLIQCDCSRELLTEIEAEVRDRSIPDEFKFRFVLRMLIRKVVDHLRECTQIGKMRHSRSLDSPDVNKNLPALERLVYFVRDVLEYSKRDTALLIGITDAQADKLLSLARRRIDMYEGPSALKIEAANGAYFRWKVVDLHLP